MSLYSMRSKLGPSIGKVNDCLIDHQHERDLSLPVVFKSTFMTQTASSLVST